MLAIKPLLVVANSGRVLTEMLGAIGFNVVVIDVFADQDTQSVAQLVIQVKSLALVDLISAIDSIKAKYDIAGMIYGGGLEVFPESLAYLAQRFRILGNDLASFQAVLNKEHFFKSLSALQIPYPAVTFEAPALGQAGWLVKPFRGQGGFGIHFHCSDSADNNQTLLLNNRYWQRHEQGEACSVLFLAAENFVQIVGFNTQWSVALADDQPFIFAGLMNATHLTKAQKIELCCWLGRLTKEFALKGLNCLDFMVSGKQRWVLEINARPSASLQLYQAAWLAKHLHVCQSMTPNVGKVNADFGKALSPQVGLSACCIDVGFVVAQKSYKAMRIVYAPCEIKIVLDFVWPAWCHDLPQPGAIIGLNQPICSIIGNEISVERLMLSLAARQETLFSALNLRY